MITSNSGRQTKVFKPTLKKLENSLSSVICAAPKINNCSAEAIDTPVNNKPP